MNRQRGQTPLPRLDKRMGQDEKAESAKADPPCPKPALDKESDTERPSGILKGRIWTALDFDGTPQQRWRLVAQSLRWVLADASR